MSQRNIIIAAIVVVLLVVLGGGAYYLWGGSDDNTPVQAAQTSVQPTPEAAGPIKVPVIAVIDHDAILEKSKMGQDISRQIEALADQAKQRLEGPRQALENQNAELEKQLPGLAPDVRQKRIAALEEQQRAFQAQAQGEQDKVKAALQQANTALAKAMTPILEAIVKEHGISIVLDKHAVIMSGDPRFDVTNEAVSRLDAVATSYTPDSSPALPQ